MSKAQARLLGSVLYAATGGEAQAHLNAGGGGSTSKSGWRDLDKDKRKYKGRLPH